jgi:hypothetical protein
VTNQTDPPVDLMDPPGLDRLDWSAIAAEVRKHPGQWCRVPRSMNPTVAMHIKRGKYPHIPPEQFDVVTRKDYEVHGKSWIFLRLRG